MMKCLMTLVLCLGSILAGCTLVETSDERGRRIAHLTDLQMRMAVYDFDAILLLDKNSTLTQWYTHVGY